MDIQRKNIIIFGASLGGKNFIEKQSEYKILAIADNDVAKIGQTLYGYTVIAPQDILNFEYDYIIVTSMYYNPIQKQLKELGIKKETIIASPKSYLKSVDFPFQDLKTIEFANSALREITRLLYENKIRYFIDFGTLLGIVRDGALIPWDDDIDLSILNDQLHELLNCLDCILANLNKDVLWSYNIIYNNNQTVSNIVLNFITINAIKSFSIDIWVIYFREGFAVQTMNKVPEIHFLDNDTVMFGDEVICVPSKYIEYLERTYGNWKVPKRDYTFADYPFAFTE